jgi:putative transposase
MLYTRFDNNSKSGGLLCSRNEVKYSFIAQHKKTWPIEMMCRLLGVRRNGYYHFQKQKHTVNLEDEELVGWMKKIAESSKNSYGSRRMKKALNALGFPLGRSKTRRLMKEASIYVRYRKKYKVTTNSNHKELCSNLVYGKIN